MIGTVFTPDNTYHAGARGCRAARGAVPAGVTYQGAQMWCLLVGPACAASMQEDFVELDGVRIDKPFVEKPVSGEDHK